MEISKTTIIAFQALTKALVMFVVVVAVLFVFAENGWTQSTPIKLRHSNSMEILRGAATDTIVNMGNVRFDQGGVRLTCDSSIWITGKRLILWGNVIYQDGASRDGGRKLLSDTLIYDLIDSVMYATGHVFLIEDESEIAGDSLKYVVADSTLYVTGDSVVIISPKDSTRAVAKEAFIDRAIKRLELLKDARVEFGYPDTSIHRSLSALYIRYDYETGITVAQEDVVILDAESRAAGDCAIIERTPARVRIYEDATIDWLGNFVSGDFITIRSLFGKPESIDVYGDALALFIDTTTATEVDTLASSIAVPNDTLLEPPTDSTVLDSSEVDTTLSDSATVAVNAPSQPETNKGVVTSKITGSHLSFNFSDGLLYRVDAFGQAYSFYTPVPVSGESATTNTASGDSIQLYVEDNVLHTVNAFGSVVGDYIQDNTAKTRLIDSADAGSNVVDSIHYTGERISFNLPDSIITLAGIASVIQAPMSLKADSIIFNTAERLVQAYSIQPPEIFEESIPTDSAATTDTIAVDSLFEVDSLGPNTEEPEADPYLGVVTLQDGSQDVDGSYIEFSLATRKGLIIQSQSAYEEAYYTGAELFREKDDIFLVNEGTYTTCEYDSPHFHFWSKHMKMIRGKQMIAKPVVFFIEKIPVFILPFYVFPLQEGRRSGILNFRFGNFNRGGRFLANLGYYWAASEYWDIQSWMDYYESSGPAFSSQVRYNKRYSFSGNVAASIAYTNSFDNFFQQTKTKRWRFNFNHRQTISPTFNLNASGNFLSDSKYFTDFTDNLDARLTRTLRSQVNFSKNFGRTSLNGSFVSDENLDGDKRKTKTFPNLTFSIPAVQIFGSAPSREEQRWYHTIRMGYSSTLRHFSEGRDSTDFTVTLTDTTVTIDTVFATIFDTTIVPADSIGVDTLIDTSSTIDVVAIDTTESRTTRAFTTYRHGTSIGPNFTILKYFPVSFALRYNETWFNVDATNRSLGAGIQTDRFYRTYTTSANASISTHLYGTVNPNLFGLRGIRHEMNPSISYSYTPNIRFDEATKAAAAFAGVRSITNRSQLINFGLRNVFEIKVGSEESSKKLTLLTLNSSLSYNPEATERRWSSMNTRFQSSVIKRVTMSGNMVHSFYEDGGLQSLSVNTSFGTGGNFGEFLNYIPESLGPPSGPRIGAPRNAPLPVSSNSQGDRTKSRTWSFSLNHTYSQTKNNPIKRNFATIRVNLQLTPNMTIDYTQSYDIFNKSTVNRNLRIHRILHRWEGVFNWTPSGSNRGFSFRVNVIAIPDIKLEKSLTSSLGRQLPL